MNAKEFYNQESNDKPLSKSCFAKISDEIIDCDEETHTMAEMIVFAEAYHQAKLREEKRIKSLFETYFDGCYDVDAQPNTSNTFVMGVCKLDYNEKENELTVHLRRPGLLIGKAGTVIDDLKKYLACEIKIIEVKYF